MYDNLNYKLEPEVGSVYEKKGEETKYTEAVLK
jgi:hypothetical protein